MKAIIHPSAQVASTNIGNNTVIWQYVVVLEGAVIGDNCTLSAHVFIEEDVVIGNNVTIKSGVHLWNGLRLEDDVFIGPAVTFTNDNRPRSKYYKPAGITVICRGASLGANSTIHTDITIGEYAMTGMGSVVTHDVPPHALVYGNPARIRGWIDKKGRDLIHCSGHQWKDQENNEYFLPSAVPPIE